MDKMIERDLMDRYADWAADNAILTEDDAAFSMIV